MKQYNTKIEPLNRNGAIFSMRIYHTKRYKKYFVANLTSAAQVTQWRGCYDDVCKFRRIETTSNSPEFPEKKWECVVT